MVISQIYNVTIVTHCNLVNGQIYLHLEMLPLLSL